MKTRPDARWRWRKVPPCFAMVLAGCLHGCAAGPSKSRIAFDSAGDRLHGLLVVPSEGTGPWPVVLFVHGDGALDAEAYGYYAPIRNALADRGIASFSWDKPGVGGSTGDWLAQDMDDRAAEVVDAFQRVGRHPQVVPHGAGVIGFSQAGWVLPRLAGQDWLDYLVFVSPAIDWGAQGEFFMRKRHDPGGAPDESIEPASERRRAFLHRNRDENSTRRLADIDVPVLALFGEDDLNVDVHDSIEVFTRMLGDGSGAGPDIRSFPGATHGLMKSGYLNRQIPGLSEVLQINLLGAATFVDGMLDGIGDFARAHSGVRPGRCDRCDR